MQRIHKRFIAAVLGLVLHVSIIGSIPTVAVVGVVGTGAIVTSGCFGEKDRVAALRLALAGAPLLTARLVRQGVISAAQEAGIVKDFKDGLNVGLTFGEELKAAKTAMAKYEASKKAYDEWLKIYKRGNFGVHPEVLAAADIADGIFEFIQAYYADKAGVISHSDIAVDGMSERDFKDALDQRIKQLKEAFEEKK